MNQRQVDYKTTLDFILKNIDNSRKVSTAVYKIKNSLIDLALGKEINEQQFYKITSMLTPQSRSPMWERYFITKNGCKKVKSNENKGDFEKNGVFYEYKSSGYNQDEAIHIVQIRLWQECNYVIQSISDNSILTFILSHEEMVLETNLLKATVAHGTKQISKVNKHNELRMTLFPDSEDWIRWIDKYKDRDFL